MTTQEVKIALKDMHESLEKFIESLTVDISFIEDEDSRYALQAIIRQANNWKKFNEDLLEILD